MLNELFDTETVVETPVEETKIDLEQIMTDVAEATKLEADLEELENAENNIDRILADLEDIANDVDLENLNAGTIKLYRTAATKVLTGKEIDGGLLNFDTEAEIVDPAKTFEGDLEAVKEFAKKAKEAAKKAWKKFKMMAVKLFARFMGLVEPSTKVLEELGKEVKESGKDTEVAGNLAKVLTAYDAIGAKDGELPKTIDAKVFVADGAKRTEGLSELTPLRVKGSGTVVCVATKGEGEEAKEIKFLGNVEVKASETVEVKTAEVEAIVKNAIEGLKEFKNLTKLFDDAAKDADKEEEGADVTAWRYYQEAMAKQDLAKIAKGLAKAVIAKGKKEEPKKEEAKKEEDKKEEPKKEEDK
jgi:hypothetical protein